MLIVRLVAVARPACVLATTAALMASAGAAANDLDKGILFDSASQTISAESVSGLLAMKLGNLAEIDPDHPLASNSTKQTLSMFGREDIIASSSKNYAATHCPARTPAANILDEITRRARQTSIVIVNESHERSEGRGFTTMLAVRLRPLGYDALALEALQNDPPTTPKQYRSPFVRQPDLPYFEDDDGFYLGEAAFGRMGRRAKALGYRLVSYEANPNDGLPPGATLAQRTAVREEEQAANLAAFLKEHPGTKLLVHVGYQHVLEVPRADGSKRMAALLKQKTGIDPLTISQTDCRGGGESDRLAILPADQAPGSFDLVVDHPRARFDRGRPVWREMAGDRPVSVPATLRPSTGWRVIEARPINEPVTSVPMDRVAIRPKEDVALMLPPGRYQYAPSTSRGATPRPLHPSAEAAASYGSFRRKGTLVRKQTASETTLPAAHLMLSSAQFRGESP